MMKFIKKTLFFILICPIIIQAQSQSEPLKVGDSLPNFIIPKLINPKQFKIQTSEFSNKLLIIDFWSTGCSSCIKALPRMESLQKRFGDKIKILPLTYENEGKITAFWQSNKYTKILSIPTVVEDKMFHMYFPHYGVPHEVWIYKGKVIAITAEEYVDVPNIQRILNGEKVNWNIKYDFYKYDYSKPLFKSKNSVILSEYSALRGYLPRVNSLGFTGGRSIIRDTLHKTIRAVILNEPIYVTYVVNFMAIYKQNLIKPTASLDSNQVIWEVSDPSRYMHSYKKDTPYPFEWVIKNAVCFESLQVDKGQSDADIYNSINKDFDRLLGLHVRWEKRNEKVWILKRISSDRSFLNSGIPGIGLSISDLGEMFNKLAEHVYVFDETNMVNSNFWMNKVVINKYADLNTINKAINPYGFEMIEEKRDVDKLIFSELNGGLIMRKHTK